MDVMGVTAKCVHPQERSGSATKGILHHIRHICHTTVGTTRSRGRKSYILLCVCVEKVTAVVFWCWFLSLSSFLFHQQMVQDPQQHSGVLKSARVMTDMGGSCQRESLSDLSD
jgi:hypothetical protein